MPMTDQLTTNPRNEKGNTISVDSIQTRIWTFHDSKYYKSTILSDEGQTYTVSNTLGTFKVSKSKTYPINSEDFDISPNLSQLSYLNEPSVLNILTTRFFSQKIYTNSGIFLVALNPYRNLEIYSEEIMNYYTRAVHSADSSGFDEDVPPHIFRITSNAYSELLNNQEDHSILITGESGAGKTENTKKVIQYLSHLDSKTNNLEKSNTEIADLIMETTELLEFFGNAKTTRNDNSSRFGKFIKLIFSRGKLVGAKVDKYLLEKSRVTKQNAGERNYHIFHALVSSSVSDKFYVKNVESRVFSNKGLKEINSDKANEQLAYVSNALKKLSINVETVLKIISSIILLNSLEFTENGEQAGLDPKNREIMQKACELLSIDSNGFTATLLFPKKTVGGTEVTYNISRTKAHGIITGFSRYVYEKLFDHLIDRINSSLYTSQDTQTNFIGILDIAGFEIFKNNSFEQLCINYTNEKLQQYFNHTMFISEQKLYESEGIKWNYIDFGLDLQPTIDFLESHNPTGLFGILDDEAIRPTGNEITFIEELSASDITELRKEDQDVKVFELDELNTGHFKIHHYAGTVSYNTEGWIAKNKDTSFDFFDNSFANCTDNTLKSLLSKKSEKLKGVGKGFFKTVAQTHKVQLAVLMQSLSKTIPHFVRCIIPNENKSYSEIDTPLMLQQLRCNGVIEGIRISRKGYPNRLSYDKFRRRYSLLLSNVDVVASEPCTEEKSRKICDQIINIGTEELKKMIAKGRNKIFLKSGAMAILENMRDQKIKIYFQSIKSLFVCYLSIRKNLRSEIETKSVENLKRNVEYFLALRKNQWFRLFLTVKPLLDINRNENLMKEKQKEIDDLVEMVRAKEEQILELQTQVKDLGSKLDTINGSLEVESQKVIESDQKISNLVQTNKKIYDEAQKTLKHVSELESVVGNNKQVIQTLTEQLDDIKTKNVEKTNELEDLNQRLENLKENQEKLTRTNEELKQEVEVAEVKIQSLKSESESELSNLLISKQEDLSSKQIELDTLAAQKTELESQMKNKNTEVQDLKSKKEELGGENHKLSLELLEMTNKNSLLEEEKSKIQDQNTEQLSKYKDLETNLSKQLSSLMNSNKSLESENEDLTYNLSENERRLNSTNSALKTKQFELANLQSELDREILTNQTLKDRITEEIALRDRMLEEQKEDFLKSSDTALKLQKAEKKIQQLSKTLEITQNDYETILNEQQMNDSAWFEKMRNQNETSNAETKKLKNLITDLNYKIKKLERENAELIETQRSAETDSSTADEYNAILMKERAVNKELRRKLNATEQKLILLEGMKSNVDDSQLSALENQMKEMENDLHIFYSNTLKNVFDEFNAEKTKNQQLLDTLTEKMNEIHEKEKQFKKNEIALMIQKTKYQSLLEESKTRDSLKTELKKLKDSLLKYRMMDQQTLLEKQALVQEVESLKLLIDGERRNITNLNSKIAELRSDNELLKRQTSVDSELKVIDSMGGVQSFEKDSCIQNLEKKIESLEDELADRESEISILKLNERGRIKMESKSFMKFINEARKLGSHGSENVDEFSNENSTENLNGNSNGNSTENGEEAVHLNKEKVEEGVDTSD